MKESDNEALIKKDKEEIFSFIMNKFNNEKIKTRDDVCKNALSIKNLARDKCIFLNKYNEESYENKIFGHWIPVDKVPHYHLFFEDLPLDNFSITLENMNDHKHLFVLTIDEIMKLKNLKKL